MLNNMASDNAGTVSVVDFRRQGMLLQWHVLGGTWSAHEVPPSLAHGVALIRATQPNICVYAHNNRLRLQIGPDQYTLSENSPRLRCTRGLASFGLRRRFTVQSSTGGVLFSHPYWTPHAEDFFLWLATKAQDPDWRAASGRQWSEGLPAALLRAS